MDRTVGFGEVYGSERRGPGRGEILSGQWGEAEGMKRRREGIGLKGRLIMMADANSQRAGGDRREDMEPGKLGWVGVDVWVGVVMDEVLSEDIKVSIWTRQGLKAYKKREINN